MKHRRVEGDELGKVDDAIAIGVSDDELLLEVHTLLVGIVAGHHVQLKECLRERGRRGEAGRRGGRRGREGGEEGGRRGEKGGEGGRRGERGEKGGSRGGEGG